MRSQIQPSRAIRVVKDDNINIPNPAAQTITGTATSTTVGKLVDSAQDFSVERGNPVAIGDIVFNTRDNTIATVTAIDSPDTLSLSADIMANTETYTIYKPNQNLGCLLYITGVRAASDKVKVLTSGGDTVELAVLGTPGTSGGWGVVLPLQVVRVFKTDTTASLTIHAFFN
tara:strand:- start:267 stop:782 length:516 start_codon:yes stop_codon:yes gene_type:complete